MTARPASTPASAPSPGFKCDMMLERPNMQGEALIIGSAGVMIDQTLNLERAIVFEDSDSLDNPEAVFK
ncbi:hypothetical protein [Pontivivens ytuae]